MSRRTRLLSAIIAMALTATACFGGGEGDAPGDDLLVTATVLRSANLFVGSEVRVLGLPVGEIANITPKGDTVEVQMLLDGARQYPADVNVRLTPLSLLGERFAALDPPYTTGPTLQNGAHVPLERTGIPAEVDEVLRSFEEFLNALDGNALADLIDVLSDTLDGNGQGLNDLIGSGARTVRVLADSSVDLNQVVRDLGDLNETLATREERIGSTLVNASTVLRNLQGDRDLLIGALNELERSVSELQPIVTEHGDPLVRNLDTLATTLGTVDRNLERLGDAFFGSRRLFTTASRGVDYENGRIRLDNEAGFLGDELTARVGERLIGLCLRLDLADCGSVGDVLDQLPGLCIPGLCAPGDGDMAFTEAIGIVLASMPTEVRAAVEADLAERVEVPAQQEEPAPTPVGPIGRLPAADPRLGGAAAEPSEEPTTEATDGPLLPILPGRSESTEEGDQ